MSEIKYRHSICWIRRDLRLSDHVALSAAKQNSEFVTVVFVFDTTILNKLEDKDDRRLTFIHQSLQVIHKKLQDFHSGLVVLIGDPAVEIPRVAKILKVDAVYANMDVEPYAKKRDQKVFNGLKNINCEFHLLKDHVIFAGLEVRKKSGEAFKVFTPYKKQWLMQFQSNDMRDVSIRKNNFTHHSDLKAFQIDWTLKDLGYKKNSLWIEAGEDEGMKKLKRFSTVISKYHTERNFPASHGTSGLSVHLRFGTISVRACVREAIQKKNEGSSVWLSELIWRDFYQMILDQYPHVAEKAFKPKYQNIRWSGSDRHFKAWCEGKTGYPIVDAAMKHFNQTGWMHNRLRMVVAMFLCKDLLVDWRKGEKYFARYLLDFDLGSNNGGWQWCSSTGCDAQPYFRIFNPILQSMKFDAKATFIRQHCPELQKFSDKHIHAPWITSKEDQKKAECIIGKNYPKPIVDHAIQRKKVLSLFKKI